MSMSNNYIFRADTEDAYRSDGAHSLRKVFPLSIKRATQQGDYYMELAHYLFLFYRPLTRKEDQKIIKELYEQAGETSMEIVSDKSSPLRKFVKAFEYRNLANLAYLTIKRASGHHDTDDETIIKERARAMNVMGTVYPDVNQCLPPDTAVLESYSEEELRAVTSVTPTDLFGPPSSETLDF